MSPQNPSHAGTTTLVQSALLKVFQTGWVVRIQLPLALGEHSEPEPDLAVVRGHERDYVKAHPTTAALIVEVADTTVEFDRGHKAPVYARAGIPDYWLLNLPERALEVRRDPDRARGEYQEVVRYGQGEAVSPLAAPQARIAVADLLP